LLPSCEGVNTVLLGGPPSHALLSSVSIIELFLLVPGPLIDLALAQSTRCAEPCDLLLCPLRVFLELYDEHLDLALVFSQTILLRLFSGPFPQERGARLLDTG
jgi:hypothetical protein